MRIYKSYILCVIFLTHIYRYVLSVTVLTLWRLLKCSAFGIGFNGAEPNCGIAHILGILLMNSYNTDIFFSNYCNLQSVHFEYIMYMTLEFLKNAGAFN